MRVMGSDQQDDTDVSKPLAVYVGEISRNKEVHVASRMVPALHLSSEQWDVDNYMFRHPLWRRQVNECDLEGAELSSTFSLTWNKLEVSSSRNYSLEVVDPREHVVGTMNLRFPTLYLRGDSLVDLMRSELDSMGTP